MQVTIIAETRTMTDLRKKNQIRITKAKGTFSPERL